MPLRFHEIAEGSSRILNPFLSRQLMLLGEICNLNSETTILDLACGKGEMLCRWAEKHGVSGTGVDVSHVFLAAAKSRAAELGVADKVTFIQGDAGAYQPAPQAFDIVSCIGATWIGNGIEGTVNLMKPALKPGGTILIGEPFWHEPPPEAAYGAMRIKRDEFTSLAGTLDRFESAGLNLVEMVLADHEGWDRYESPQWMAVDSFLKNHPNDPDAAELRLWSNKSKRSYLEFGRRYLGWGVFVLRF